MLRSIYRMVLVSSLGVVPTAALGQIQVKDAWVRGTVPAQTATGAFMEITSKSDSKLVGAASPAAGKVEVHNMKMENGVMKMAPVAAIDLPAGKPVLLGPGGYHVLLMDLKQQLKTGEKVVIMLSLEGADRKRQTMPVTADVRELTSAAKGSGAGHSKH